MAIGINNTISGGLTGTISNAGGPLGLVVAGLSGGSGKSVVAVGLIAALSRAGGRVAPFKKGPDYIDAGWLALAAGIPCNNLDPFLMPPEILHGSFLRHCRQADYALIEGNRGLFDGVDLAGTCSTAELAVALGLPVLLVVDCTKSTRTVAALVLGCRDFDPRVRIGGVILNRIGTGRHEGIVRQAVEHYTGIPVLGALPRSREDVFPQRHLGVTPGPEHEDAGAAIILLADRIGKYLDLTGIKAIMAPVTGGEEDMAKAEVTPVANPVRIGVIRDAAFQFYYQENLEALVVEGAELVEINALADRELPNLDALYIGGGFPENRAAELAANHTFRASLRERVAAGLPVYAECGGLIYLGRRITMAGQSHELVGIFPVDFTLEKKPQAHGYTRLVVEGDNPFYPVGARISGHEFRYSRVQAWAGEQAGLVAQVERGVGFVEGRDGLVYKNVLALYTHIHALGTPEWAPAMVRRAQIFRSAQALP
ncbi:MAG: cobyrinate a,c-diamide synthase [Desulfobulbaceae bacterium]|nr:cobyrinate a,c-diamide synthase [Desulfobulbaceae bacterium]